MKKMLKIIGIVLVVIILALIIGISILSKMPSPGENYFEKIETGGEIEAKYLKEGKYETSYYEEKAPQIYEKYEIYYPSELENSNKKYPVIVVCNGTGWKASKSISILKHYASWGFIVIGTEETYSWNAFAAEMSVRHLERLNGTQTINDKENMFYQKIDFDNVGVIGHSQGGVGVFNSLTNIDCKDTFKTGIALSPTNKVLAEGLEWFYDVSKIAVPVMLISGEGGGDDWVVTGEQLEDIYNDISSSKVMLRRKNAPHGVTNYYEDGYVIAWFMWQLQGDKEASYAFIGDNPEILSNKLYQDQKIDY